MQGMDNWQQEKKMRGANSQRDVDVQLNELGKALEQASREVLALRGHVSRLEGEKDDLMYGIEETARALFGFTDIVDVEKGAGRA